VNVGRLRFIQHLVDMPLIIPTEKAALPLTWDTGLNENPKYALADLKVLYKDAVDPFLLVTIMHPHSSCIV
jgi:hypothetical protein